MIILGFLICSGIFNPDKELIYIHNRSEKSSAKNGLVPDVYIINYILKNDGIIYNDNTMKKINKLNFKELFILKYNIAKLKMYIHIHDIPETDKKEEFFEIEGKRYNINSFSFYKEANETYKKIRNGIEKFY